MNTEKKQTDLGLVTTIQRLTKFLRNGKIDYDDYASNVIFHLVGKRFHDVCESLADLSIDEHVTFVKFARTYFDSNEYSPSPIIFMVDSSDPDEVEKKRVELRPKYQQLMKDLENCNN